MAYYEYDEFKAKINAVRETTYKEIIARICKEFDLNFTIDDTVDLYSAAYYLYDFFVSSFNIYLVQFFSQYIFKERASIYEAMGLAEMRKNKDSSTTYGKRLYKDIRLAVINANIDQVISFITGIDIDLGSIFSLVLIREKANYLGTLVSERNDFFKTSYAGILNSVMRPILLTEIRFRLQGFAKAHEPEIVEGNENEE